MLDGLAGIRWGGIVAAGGSVAACALCSPAWTRGAGNQPLGTRDQPRCWFLNKCFYSAEDDRDEYQFGGDDGVDVEKQWWCSRSLDGNARGLGELWFGEGQSKKDTSGFEESDVDLFLVGLDADEARSKIRHIHAILAQNWVGRLCENQSRVASPPRGTTSCSRNVLALRATGALRRLLRAQRTIHVVAAARTIHVVAAARQRNLARRDSCPSISRGPKPYGADFHTGRTKAIDRAHEARDHVRGAVAFPTRAGRAPPLQVGGRGVNGLRP